MTEIFGWKKQKERAVDFVLQYWKVKEEGWSNSSFGIIEKSKLGIAVDEVFFAIWKDYKNKTAATN